MKPGYYESLDFNAPMTEATADRLVAELAAAEPASILDVGCGWAELLLRLLDACPGATGLGVDHDEALIARAVANASARNLDSRVQFAPEIDDLEAADLVVNIGAESSGRSPMPWPHCSNSSNRVVASCSARRSGNARPHQTFSTSSDRCRISVSS